MFNHKNAVKQIFCRHKIDLMTHAYYFNMPVTHFSEWNIAGWEHYASSGNKKSALDIGRASRINRDYAIFLRH